MENNLIKIKNLSITLDKKIRAIKNISLEVEQGKITGFIGPSGAGKTTLIKAIVGGIEIEKGTITLLDKTPGDKSLRNQIAYMSQDLALYQDLTLEENLEYFAKLLGIKKRLRRNQISEILDRLEMTDKKKILIEELSGGQKQRSSLAVSLLGNPKVLILDEPTIGLDPNLRNKLWILFRELSSSGVSIIITSHSMDEASRCDDLVLISEGKLIAHDSPIGIRKITESKNIEEAFIKLVSK